MSMDGLPGRETEYWMAQVARQIVIQAEHEFILVVIHKFRNGNFFGAQLPVGRRHGSKELLSLASAQGNV